MNFQTYKTIVMKPVVCRRRAFSAIIYRIAKKAMLKLSRYSATVNKLLTKEKYTSKDQNL